MSTPKIRRNTYLSSKGGEPSGQHQLSLIFPDAIGKRRDMRRIPNDYVRSSLFTVGSDPMGDVQKRHEHTVKG